MIHKKVIEKINLEDRVYGLIGVSGALESAEIVLWEVTRF